MFTARIATRQFASPRMLDRFIDVIREMTTRREINELLLRRGCDIFFLYETRVALIIPRKPREMYRRDVRFATLFLWYIDRHIANLKCAIYRFSVYRCYF